MRHPVIYTHATRHYRGAVFVPAVTEESAELRLRGVTKDEARAIYERRVAEEMAGPGTRTKIDSNVYGTWIHVQGMTGTAEIEWTEHGKYLGDTPLPITCGTWHYMLNVLPPSNWRQHGPVESFQMCELMTGNVTSTLVKIGNAYWHVYGELGEAPDVTLQRLREGIKAQVIAGYGEVAPLRRGLCSCCGAGIKLRQWWNRDTGYGLCNECIPQNSTSGADMTELEFGFGLQGYHFADVLGEG